ncbi:hypothetical protein [Nakamurella endophytica]|uniref:hypothetical protein n=1 Tax=Nakamurella endophytica TaxID=1748367 RepID=UPI001668BA5F|nr:hypothetical protein [Nakamurella endophytica]
MQNYDTEAWHDLFVATAGAAAALAGLVFVAVSINIERILALAGVPERGLQTVVLLLGAVVISVFGLVPQGTSALGVEALCVSAALLAVLLLSRRAAFTGMRGHPGWLMSRLLVLVPGTLLYAVGGISLLAGAGGGLAWVLAGILGALLGAVSNAWVLLVEILR